MDYVGNLENISVSGCLYLYSGEHQGALSAIPAFSPKKDRGLMLKSAVLDSTPSGLVRAYNHKGVWKQRLVRLTLCAEGVRLLIFRPPRVTGLGSVFNRDLQQPPSPSSPGSPTFQNNSLDSNDFASSSPKLTPPLPKEDAVRQWEEDTKLSMRALEMQKGTVKVDFVLSNAPMQVRKLHLTPDDGRGGKRVDPSFTVKCVNSVRGEVTKVTIPFIIQVSLEKLGLIEFVGRDVDHMNKWLERVKMVSIVHRTYHQIQRVVQNVGQYPATPEKNGEFSISVLNRSTGGVQGKAMEGSLWVRQDPVGFSVVLRGDVGAEGFRYFRICFDEAPLLEKDSAAMSAVELSANEHDACLAATCYENVCDIFANKSSIRLRVEMPSLASLGRLFYFNKWCSFISAFCRHFEGTVEDRMLQLPSSTSFATTTTRRSATLSVIETTSQVPAPDDATTPRRKTSIISVATDDDYDEDDDNDNVDKDEEGGEEDKLPDATQPPPGAKRSFTDPTSPFRSALKGEPQDPVSAAIVKLREMENTVRSVGSFSTHQERIVERMRLSEESARHILAATAPATKEPCEQVSAVQTGASTPLDNATAAVADVAFAKAAHDDQLCRDVPLQLIRREYASIMNSITEYHQKYSGVRGVVSSTYRVNL